MIIGQIGIGFALKTLSKSTNLGWIIASTLFLDALLWVFVLFGIESYSVPMNYEHLRHFTYEFPYSHGILAVLFWTFSVYILVRIYTTRQKTAVLMAIGIFSSLLLNIVTHPPEIPLLFQNSIKVGLGLSNHVFLNFVFEALILMAGLYLYFKFSYSKTFLGKYGIIVFIILLVYFDFGQLYLKPDPSDHIDTALSSLSSLVTIVAITFWLDKMRSHHSFIMKKPSDIFVDKMN